ncbi:hypothetical protein HHI36_013403 [Cryptolaemus montrouzieri]|uniref:peptidylprolyl isomerase n=1 Tax=Cryptolaemus montrouzieri TaxID=559131 RepID=A0ABD2NH24_9CUCU
MQDVEEQSEEESGGEEESGDEEESAEDEFSDEEDDEELEDDDDDDEEEDEEDSKPDIVVNGLGKKAKKERKELQESPKKGPQETPKKDKQGKDKPNLKQTPGPKAKQQENGRVEDQKSKEKKEKKNKDNQSQTPKKKTLPGGVVVEDLREGSGDAASNGKFVHVYYEGRLKSNNKVFDKTQNGPGFGFRLGKGEVIKGWDLGVSGMKVGGKRRITCPPHLAYGPKGSPPVIPPNSTLVFEVELKKIK